MSRLRIVSVKTIKQIKMKKVLLVLVLGLGLTSCNNDNEYYYDIECPKTDVRINIKSKEVNTKTASRSTNSDVNRGDIPVAVKEINVTSESVSTGIDREASYNLVDDGSGVDGFVISDVPLGENNFVATTTAVAKDEYESKKVNLKKTTVQAELDSLKLKTPYAVYEGSNSNVDITGVNDFVSLDMNTVNGRRITGGKLAESIRDEYTWQVVVHTFNRFPEVYNLKGTQGMTTYWSASDAVEGDKITFLVEVYSKATGVKVYSTTLEQDVIASTGVTSNYTVYADRVESESVGLNFTFQEWEEIEEGN